MIPKKLSEIFESPGDHAGEWETSMMMYLTNNAINLDLAGNGDRIPFKIKQLYEPGVWTPRPWKQSHPDTGSGNPRKASFEKGKEYVDSLCQALCDVMVDLSKANKGDLPFL
jgi:creatinine amidohydrolase